MMLIILPEHRGKGIGERLIQQLSACPDQSLALRVFRTNSQALKFYQKMGFEVLEDEGDFYYLARKTDDLSPSIK